MNRSAAATVAIAVSLLAVQAAAADTRSWTAVKKVVGKGDAIVVGIDLAKLRTTAAFQAGLSMFLDAEPDAKGVFDTVQSTCGIDLKTAVSDLTVVLQGGDEKPLVAFGLDGVDEAKVIDCLGLVAGQMMGMPAVKLKAKRLGKITEYSVKGEKKKLYAAWLAKDVFAFTDDPNDRKRLEKRLAGKGAKGDLATFLGRTSPASPFWFAVAKREREDGRTIIGGYGKVDLVGALVKVSGAVVMATPAEATATAAEGNQALPVVTKELATKLPELGRALTTVKLTASGAEVVITGSVPDKDIAIIVPQLDKVF